MSLSSWFPDSGFSGFFLLFRIIITFNFFLGWCFPAVPASGIGKMMLPSSFMRIPFQTRGALPGSERSKVSLAGVLLVIVLLNSRWLAGAVSPFDWHQTA